MVDKENILLEQLVLGDIFKHAAIVRIAFAVGLLPQRFRLMAIACF